MEIGEHGLGLVIGRWGRSGSCGGFGFILHG